ncbi:DUF6538 domain-containing protein [Bauldia litoralis]|uniref:DUF6538 domain-containing protein n=1 Tax=Bauldia litoralis TaxID=665467 RepID=UPI003262F19F
MLFRLVRPMLRKGSSNRYFIQRIPADVRDRASGLTLAVPCGAATVPIRITPKTKAVRFSLRTGDPGEVKARQAEAAAYLENVWHALREDAPVPLTHKQAVALSGELYRAWTSGEGRERVLAVVHDPETGEWTRDHEGPHADERLAEWETVVETIGRLDDERDQETVLGPIVDRLLQAKGLGRVDRRTRAVLLAEFRRALLDAFETRKRNAQADYSPDPKAERFPEWRAPGTQTSAGQGTPGCGATQTLTGLVEDWWREAKATGRSVSTYESYRNTMKRLAAFLAHDDARRVTIDDVLRFKDHRLSEVSAKTVKDSDLVGLKSVFGWALDNRRIETNPAQGVTVKRSKKVWTREKGFTPDEAKAILTHALHHERGREAPKTFAAKRWVPWLCAYTGARVGEIVQLRKKDVRSERGHWMITITPEAGTVKTKEAREVPLHEHLIELGFGDFVERSADGYLFLGATPGEDIRGRWEGCKNRVREFVREVATDVRIAPNHAWRHLFKTMGREADIQERVLAILCGQVATTDGEDYGNATMQAKLNAIAKLPRFDVT